MTPDELICASCSSVLGSAYYGDVPDCGDLCIGCWEQWMASGTSGVIKHVNDFGELQADRVSQ